MKSRRSRQHEDIRSMPHLHILDTAIHSLQRKIAETKYIRMARLKRNVYICNLSIIDDGV
jgi:hypothetical protein